MRPVVFGCVSDWSRAHQSPVHYQSMMWRSYYALRYHRLFLSALFSAEFQKEWKLA